MQTSNLQTQAVAQDLLSKLNVEQQQAVSLGWGPALIVAGAGSGKTTVLTRRLAYLIAQLGQRPGSCLAVTFTNKAAAEMKARVEKIVGADVARKMTIGTFHSICARMLRREIASYNSADGHKWHSNFVIYDETDSLNLVKAAVTKLNLDEKVFAPKEMRHAISALKNDGYTAFQFSKDAHNYRDQRLSEIFNHYQRELARNNALDFDDLILVFTDLLEQNQEVRDRMRSYFRHVLVDEFQDTNQSQYKLIRLLSVDDKAVPDAEKDAAWSERSLMVVGDVDQSIYSWRKADFRIILGFQNDFKNAALIKLEENYRSTGTILEVANSIISNNTERLEKVLRCNRGQGGKIKCFAGSDEIDEAYFVAEEIKRLAARGISLSNVCLLYRTNAQSRAIEEVLMRSNIPYTMVGGTRFYDRAEIKDIIAYLKLVYNFADGQAFNRVVNNPRRGLGKTTIERLSDYAATYNLSSIDAALQAHTVDGIGKTAVKTLYDFAVMVKRWNEDSKTLPISQLVEHVINQSTYLPKLEQEAQGSKDETLLSRVDNVLEFVAMAREFEQIADTPDLETFLTRISLVSDLDSAEFEQESVKMMTLHSAKGLEFPAVFLMGLEEGLFPHFRSLNSPSAMEEERRLMYVGVTRAEDHLYLTHSRRRMSFAGGGFSSSNYTIVSRFMSEIDVTNLIGFQPQPEVAKPAPTGRDAHGFEREKVNDEWQSPKEYKPAKAAVDSGAKRRVLSRTRPGEQTPQPEESAYKPAIAFQHLQVGDNVMHTKFGMGKVVQVIGENDKELYNIDFQTAGKKLLDPKFAKLVKLD